jgi:hypothetical protein
MNDLPRMDGRNGRPYVAPRVRAARDARLARQAARRGVEPLPARTLRKRGR